MALIIKKGNLKCQRRYKKKKKNHILRLGKNMWQNTEFKSSLKFEYMAGSLRLRSHILKF